MTVTRSIKIPCHDLWHFDCHVQILILLSNDLKEDAGCTVNFNIRGRTDPVLIPLT